MCIPKTVRILSVGFVLGALLASGGVAAATYVRVAEPSCSPNHGDAADYRTQNGATWKYTSGTGYLYCSVPDSATYPHASASGGGVYGFNYSGSTIGATTCIKYYNGTGGVCDDRAYSSAQGVTSVSLSPLNWAYQPYDFAYLVIDLTGDGNSYFYGYGITY